MKHIRRILCSIIAAPCLFICGPSTAQSKASPQELQDLAQKLIHSLGNYSYRSDQQVQPDPATVETENEYNQTVANGKACLKAGNTDTALADFQKAQILIPGYNMWTDLDMAQVYVSKGQYSTAIALYRSSLYDGPHHNNLALGNYGDPNDWMSFALALQQTGQTNEAVYNYDIGAYDFNYDSGKPRRKVQIPSFGSNAGQVAYDAQVMQAMALVVSAQSNEGFDDASALKKFKQALKIAPNSAEASFFLGEYYRGKRGHAHDAQSAYLAAKQYGNAAVSAAADQILNESGFLWILKWEPIPQKTATTQLH